MLNNPILKAKDTISASLAECFITIDGNRYNFMQAITSSHLYLLYNLLFI